MILRLIPFVTSGLAESGPNYNSIRTEDWRPARRRQSDRSERAVETFQGGREANFELSKIHDYVGGCAGGRPYTQE
jgi:hypothetical protein